MKKKILFSILGAIILISAMISSNGCVGLVMEYVPAGYVGRIMTPSGWDNNILEQGQVNIGAQGANGQYSTLVLLEATTITLQEQFRSADFSTDKIDHRIVTGDGVPTTVDMYVRVMLPDDKNTWNNIFVQITPQPYKNNNRVSVITLNDIYARFVEMDTRNAVRDVMMGYGSFMDIQAHYTEANAKISSNVLNIFKKNNVPLKLQDAELSQVLPDPQIWDAEVKKKNADAQVYTIQQIGNAMAQNPGYQEFLKWQSLQNIAATAAQNGNNTVIITDSANSNGVPVVIDANNKNPNTSIIPTPTLAPTEKAK